MTGYLNSDFHKSFKQPLVSRAREEDQASHELGYTTLSLSGSHPAYLEQEIQKQRQFLVEHFSPSELASISSPFDLPLPKLRSKNRSKSVEKKKASEEDAR